MTQLSVFSLWPMCFGGFFTKAREGNGYDLGFHFFSTDEVETAETFSASCSFKVLFCISDTATCETIE